MKWRRICKLKRNILSNQCILNTKEGYERKTITTTSSSISATEKQIDSTIHPTQGDYSHQDIKTVSRLKDYLAAISDALISSTPSIIAINSIDWDVFEAIRHSATKTIDLSQWSNLREYLDLHYFDLGEPDGFLNRLIGYVGEIKTQEFYEHLGHDVQLAELSNQPGYDMLIDDNPVNVKTGSPQTIIDHLEKYPDIPVVTGPEQASFFNDDGMVTGIPIIEKSGLEEATNSTLEMTENDFYTGGPTIPTVTAIISGYRELKLLIKGHTDINSALKNAGLDIAGTGLGGWAGAKVGALIGTSAGPAGMVIGGVIGSISGAILGRFLTNAMKNEPFKVAVENYNQVVAFAESSIKLKEQVLAQYLSKRVETQQLRQKIAFNKLNELINQDIHKLNEWSIDRCRSFINSFIALIPEIEIALKNYEIQELQDIKRSPFLLRLVWPSLNDVKYHLVISSFRSRKKLIRRILKATRKHSKNITEFDIINFIRDYIFGTPQENEKVEKICLKLKKYNETAKNKRKEVFEAAKTVANRINIFSRLEIQKATHKAYKEIEELITKSKTDITNAKEVLEKEAHKIGIDIEKLGGQA